MTDLDEGLYDEVKLALEQNGYEIDYTKDAEHEPVVEVKNTSNDPYYLYLKDMGEISMLTLEQEKQVTQAVFEAHIAIEQGVLDDDSLETIRKKTIEDGVEAKKFIGRI